MLSFQEQRAILCQFIIKCSFLPKTATMMLLLRGIVQMNFQVDGGTKLAISATLTVCILMVLEVNTVKGSHGITG
jgi:hypothetical protein